MTEQASAPVEQPFTRADVFHTISAAITSGLPALQSIRFHDDFLSVELDSIADLDAWSRIFDLASSHGRSQPHPLDVDPAEFELWLTHQSGNWRGWYVTLKTEEPITDEQRREWVDSGRAAARAEYLAREAAQGGES